MSNKDWRQDQLDASIDAMAAVLGSMIDKDYSFLKDENDKLIGFWLKDPNFWLYDSDERDPKKRLTRLRMLPIKHQLSEDIFEKILYKKYRVVSNTANERGGCYLMFEKALAPGEKKLSDQWAKKEVLLPSPPNKTENNKEDSINRAHQKKLSIPLLIGGLLIAVVVLIIIFSSQIVSYPQSKSNNNIIEQINSANPNQKPFIRPSDNALPSTASKPSQIQLKTYSKYGLSFNYPEGMDILEKGLSEDKNADWNGGQIYLSNSRDFFFIFLWMKSNGKSVNLDAIMLDNLRDLQNSSKYTDVTIGNIEYISHNGHTTSTVTANFKNSGFDIQRYRQDAGWYCPESDRFYFIISEVDNTNNLHYARDILDSIICH